MKTILVDVEALSQVSAACSDDVSRGALLHVLVEPARMVATNGKILAVRKVESVSEGVDGVESPMDGAITVEGDLAARAAKLAKPWPRCRVESTPDNLRISSMDRSRSEGAAYVAERFPNVDSVIDDAMRHAELVTIHLDPELLMRLAKALGRTSKGKKANRVVSLRIPKPQDDGAVIDPVVVHLDSTLGIASA